MEVKLAFSIPGFHILGVNQPWIETFFFLKDCICTEHGWTFSPVIIPYTILYNNYLHSLYIALGIISHLKESYRIQEDYMRILCTPFHIRDFEHPWIFGC